MCPFWLEGRPAFCDLLIFSIVLTWSIFPTCQCLLNEHIEFALSMIGPGGFPSIYLNVGKKHQIRQNYKTVVLFGKCFLQKYNIRSDDVKILAINILNLVQCGNYLLSLNENQIAGV